MTHTLTMESADFLKILDRVTGPAEAKLIAELATATPSGALTPRYPERERVTLTFSDEEYEEIAGVIDRVERLGWHEGIYGYPMPRSCWEAARRAGVR